MSDVTVQDEPEKKTDSPAPAPVAATRSVLSGEIVFNDSIKIFSGNRIAHYDKGPAHAFIARGTDKAPPNLFALVCEDHLSPRTLKASNYAAILNPSLPRLIASGVVNWAPAGKEKYCFVYENILGNPLVKDDTHGGLGMKPEYVLNSVIRPIVNVLADMRDKDIIHGNIRVSNMFDGGVKNFERAVLGECLVLPMGYNQPALYEPVDRAMCNPLGRGTGTQKDDLYSFGVSLAIMLRHFDPMEGLSEEEIIERKLEEGSYSALLGKDRLSGAILELMRGLLYDDNNQRWNIDEIMQWLDGRRLSPKQSARKSKANRPLTFNEQRYIRPELIAREFVKHPAEARQVVESGEMEQWLSRALEDKVAAARYEKALKHAEEGGKGAGHTEQLATRVAIALHPEAPIRFKNISVLPDGIGTAFSESYMLKRDINTFVDFFMHYFITQWVDSQGSSVPDVGNLISKFDGARAYLRNKTIGHGIEKCLYSLDAEVHCLSEKLQKFHVRTPEDMMYAFEKISKSQNRPTMFFDRHSAAFLSVKDRKNVDPYLHDLNMPEPFRRIIAEMKILATIQKRSQMENFPGIAAWMVDNAEPLYERFHDRELRAIIKKKAEKAKESGDLAKIVMLFDEPAIYQEDNINFRRAMRTHHDLEQEAVEIEGKLLDEATLGIEAGHQIAALVAGALAGIIILATVFSTAG